MSDDFNGFGAPRHPVEFYELAREIGWPLFDQDYDDAGDVLEDAAKRLMIAQATGRWRVTGNYRSPATFVPGDVAALSALHTMTLMLGVPDNDDDRVTGNAPVFLESAPVARAVLRSRSYWLPAAASDAVLTSDPPPSDLLDEIRLPEQRCIVWFAQPALVPAGVVPDRIAGAADYLQRVVAEPDTQRFERPADVTFQALATIAERPHECLLEGVMLTADTEGRPADGVGWLVRTPEARAGADRPRRSLILGRRSLASWTSVTDLLSAIVSWGDWIAPEPLTIDLGGDRTARRAIRKGKARRLEEAGGLANVLVLDAKRRAVRPTTSPTGTHASPIPHARAGHYRRVRVGPREEERREIRWIHPTIVNPDGTGRDVIRIYRLPNPPPTTP